MPAKRFAARCKNATGGQTSTARAALGSELFRRLMGKIASEFCGGGLTTFLGVALKHLPEVLIFTAGGFEIEHEVFHGESQPVKRLLQ